MKKYLLSVVFVWATITTLSAATIKGRLIDNETKQIIDFATVSLFNKSSKAPMKTVTTDEKGTFSIPNVKNGSYTLRISFVGYKTLSFPYS
ncbi:MAG: carboxypeptidase regulatory-like domain-containing protein [Coprobacter sp.]